MTVTADPVPTLVTIPNVEILSVGTFPLASGITTFTDQDLASAVMALDDPAVKTPRLKFGHTQAKNANLQFGQPAVGKVENMRLSEDEQSIIGDYVGVPKWLADIFPTAYANRSIEGNFNVTTSTGGEHRLIITAVALLGVEMPGVQTIEDLQAMFSEEGPDEMEFVSAGVSVVCSVGTGGTMSKVTAGVNIEDVRRSYYEALDSTQSWWWVRAILLDPNELIVDDDQGHLYRVTFAVNGSEVTFEDPIEVKVEYVDVPEGSQSGAPTTASHREAAVFASRAESRPEQQEETQVADLNEVREALAMPDATDEEVLARVAELKASSEEGSPSEEPEGEPAGTNDDNNEGEGAEDKNGAPEPETQAGVQVPEGMRLIDEATLQELQTGAKQGVTAREVQVSEDRERMLAGAVKAGKFPPSRKEHYETMHKADPKGTEDLIASLAEGLVPVDERGTTPPDQDLSIEAYPKEWLPGVHAQTNANGQVTQEVA